jgi:hypothetical protein
MFFLHNGNKKKIQNNYERERFWRGIHIRSKQRVVRGL